MSNHRLHLVLLAALAGAPGCVGQLVDDNRGAVDSGGIGTADAAGQSAARIAFDRDVAPLLTGLRPKGACASCHQGFAPCASGGGNCFLGTAATTHYSTLMSATAAGTGAPLITIDAATSRFVQVGDHTGNAFCTGAGAPYLACTQNEVLLIASWITLEGSN